MGFSPRFYTYPIKKFLVNKIFPARVHAFSKIKGPEPYLFFLPRLMTDEFFAVTVMIELKVY